MSFPWPEAGTRIEDVATPMPVIDGAGVVSATVARTTSCGSERPTIRPIFPEFAPAAQTTVAVRIGPRSVRTALTRPAVSSIPSTAVWVRIFAPDRSADRAMASVAVFGSAWPSLGVYMPPM